MAADTPRSRIDKLQSFNDAIARAKASDLARANRLLGVPDPHNLHTYANTPAELEDRRQTANKELTDTLNVIKGGADFVIGTVDDLRVMSVQGDFMGTQHRAAVLRNAGYVRRVVHVAKRRRAHGQNSGYFDRRVDSLVVDLLKRSKQA